MTSKDPPDGRLGDETRKRIDDLAGGWDVPAEAEEPRRRSAPQSSPPPLPRKRSKATSAPPPLPPAARSRQPSMSSVLSELAHDSAATPNPGTIDSGITSKVSGGFVTEPGAEEDPTIISPPGEAMGGLARAPRSIPRKLGVLGNVAYLAAALSGTLRARRGLKRLASELELERKKRTAALVKMATEIIADSGVQVGAVLDARESLFSIEEERSRASGAVAASTEDIGTIKRTDEVRASARAKEKEVLEKERARLREELAPLDGLLAKCRRKAAGVGRALKALDDSIKAEQSNLLSAAGPADEAGIEAAVASLRAERGSVAAEEPSIADEVAGLEPRIARLTGELEELEEKLAVLREEEGGAAIRLGEQIAAVEARQVVEKRTVGDLDRARARTLKRLGDRLNRKRPGELVDRLRIIDRHELTIANKERDVAELEELIQTVDRGAAIRGALTVACALVLAGGAALWFLLG